MKREPLFYCYNCPTSGYYTINGYKYYYGEDFRSAKRYKEYLDCGFNMVQARGENSYSGEAWEGSNCQLVFKEALKAGIKKILVTDGRFDAWIREGKSLIGKDCKFKSEEELDKEVANCVAPYSKQEGFYGIQLFDEPSYDQFLPYGQLMRSIKRILPGVYVQSNLLPISAGARLLAPDVRNASEVAVDERIATEKVNPNEIYKRYLEDFVTITGADNVHFDEYPFRREYIISGGTLPNYQIASRICKDRGLDLRVVLQSFAHVWNGSHQNRRMIESDMYWQTNLAMGFGAKEYSFYTYMAKPDFKFKDGAFGELDGAAFINLDGSKTKLYDYTKRIIKQMKKMLKVINKYSYCSSHIVTESGKTCQHFDWSKFLYEDEKSPIEVLVDRGITLVTKQSNKTGELYMIENLGNVQDELFFNAKPMKIKFKLPNGNKQFYFKGEKIDIECDKNCYFIYELKVGDAIFVEIK